MTEPKFKLGEIVRTKLTGIKVIIFKIYSPGWFNKNYRYFVCRDDNVNNHLLYYEYELTKLKKKKE
jgi:hypothetical protein